MNLNIVSCAIINVTEQIKNKVYFNIIIEKMRNTFNLMLDNIGFLISFDRANNYFPESRNIISG